MSGKNTPAAVGKVYTDTWPQAQAITTGFPGYLTHARTDCPADNLEPCVTIGRDSYIKICARPSYGSIDGKSVIVYTPYIEFKFK